MEKERAWDHSVWEWRPLHQQENPSTGFQRPNSPAGHLPPAFLRQQLPTLDRKTNDILILFWFGVEIWAPDISGASPMVKSDWTLLPSKGWEFIWHTPHRTPGPRSQWAGSPSPGGTWSTHRTPIKMKEGIGQQDGEGGGGSLGKDLLLQLWGFWMPAVF